MMIINAMIGERTFRASLPDNDTARQLAGCFPLDTVFKRSGDHEFFSHLTRGIDVREIKSTSDIQSNGIYYFDGWNALSFVYKDMNIAPYRVVPLGAFEDDICGTLENAKSEIPVRLEIFEP